MVGRGEEGRRPTRTGCLRREEREGREGSAEEYLRCREVAAWSTHNRDSSRGDCHHLRVTDFGGREKQAQIIGAAEFGRRKHKKESPCDRRPTNLRTTILETDAKKANLTRTRRQVGLGCLVQPQGLKL
jgi:hypothetical protein